MSNIDDEQQTTNNFSTLYKFSKVYDQDIFVSTFSVTHI
jgi:hypothetical protein